MILNKNNGGERNIGLEWLRICSMLMIIMLHSIDHSGVLENLISGSALYYFEYFLYALVQVCVNCFVLISGYFLVGSKFKLKKLVALWIEVVFYSLIIKIIMMILGEISFSPISLLSCFVPFLTGRYWFVTIYFGMYLISPFFNIAITAMNKKQHKVLVVLLFFLFSVMISIYPSFKGMNSGGGWGLAWFSVLYFSAAYIRFYYKTNGNYIKPLIVFFSCPVLMIMALFCTRILDIGVLTSIVENLWRYDSVPVFIASLALFILFLNCNKVPKSELARKTIIQISAATFGIYLIHAHADMCTEQMWQRIGMVSNMEAWWFPIYQLVVVLSVFLLCAILDVLRQKIFAVARINQIAERVALVGRKISIYNEDCR